jgi:aminoglycoside 6-adenylyltransferase
MVLVDKDDLTVGLQPPTFAAYLPSPPTEQDYRAVIDEFFNDSAYVAKHLWRENLFPFKLNLDYIMKFQCLRRMLEWRMEIEHGWSVRPGAYGQHLKEHCTRDLWSPLESTYVGAGVEENWLALFNTIDLFRTVAVEVAEHLGFAYPHDLDEGMLAHLHKVKNLDKRADIFA